LSRCERGRDVAQSSQAGGSCAASRGLSGRREPGTRATTRLAPLPPSCSGLTYSS